MMTSPLSSRGSNASRVFSTGSPEGTMSQTARGVFSSFTRSLMEAAPAAPFVTARSMALLSMSCTTTRCPPFSSRSVIFAPMRPSPISPSSITSILEESIGANFQLETLYPLDLHSPAGPGHVLRTGEHQASTRITDDMAASLGFKPDELLLAGGRKPSSFLCVPLAARGRTIGAIAFMSADPERLVNETDLSLARDLACAAAVAMDNARLYHDAQEANRLKDEFVAMVSHELRTPLTPMLGCIHLLRTADLSGANFSRALDMIERNAHAQVQIVEDLLDVSRIVAGKLHLAIKSIQVIPVVSAAVDSVRSMA